MFKRLLSSVMVFFFVSSSVIGPNVARAQSLMLPAPGSMVNASPAFTPVLMKGLKVHPENPLLFDFIIDQGGSSLNVGTLHATSLHNEAQKLIKYFLCALTVPEKDLWVNLSPYEKDRMMNDNLRVTEMGRDMLAQDYILKQLTASMIYPEKDLGKKFWDKVYSQAQEQFGTTDIPVDTFNKVWIVADRAKVLETDNAGYVVAGHLKVMLDTDYVAANQNITMNVGALHATPLQSDSSHELAKNIIREIILPAIEKEVNEGENFATLRQMFYSMILASWYKKALKDALLNQVYADKAKTSGVLSDDPKVGEKIYAQYLEAYKKGVFNYIKDDNQSPTRGHSGPEGASVSPSTLPAELASDMKATQGSNRMPYQGEPRQYFSGGLNLLPDGAQVTHDKAQAKGIFDGSNIVSVQARVDRADKAQVAHDTAMNKHSLKTALLTFVFLLGISLSSAFARPITSDIPTTLIPAKGTYAMYTLEPSDTFDSVVAKTGVDPYALRVFNSIEGNSLDGETRLLLPDVRKENIIFEYKEDDYALVEKFFYGDLSNLKRLKITRLPNGDLWVQGYFNKTQKAYLEKAIRKLEEASGDIKIASEVDAIRTVLGRLKNRLLTPSVDGSDKLIRREMANLEDKADSLLKAARSTEKEVVFAGTKGSFDSSMGVPNPFKKLVQLASMDEFKKLIKRERLYSVFYPIEASDLDGDTMQTDVNRLRFDEKDMVFIFSDGGVFYVQEGKPAYDALKDLKDFNPPKVTMDQLYAVHDIQQFLDQEIEAKKDVKTMYSGYYIEHLNNVKKWLQEKELAVVLNTNVLEELRTKLSFVPVKVEGRIENVATTDVLLPYTPIEGWRKNYEAMLAIIDRVMAQKNPFDAAQLTYELFNGMRMNVEDIESALAALRVIFKDHHLVAESTNFSLKNVKLTLPISDPLIRASVKGLLKHDFAPRRVKENYVLTQADQENGLELLLTSSKPEGLSVQELQGVQFSIMVDKWMKTVERGVSEYKKMVSDSAQMNYRLFSGDEMSVSDITKVLGALRQILSNHEDFDETVNTADQNVKLILPVADNTVQSLIMRLIQNDFAPSRAKRQYALALTESGRNLELVLTSTKDGGFTAEELQQVHLSIMLDTWAKTLLSFVERSKRNTSDSAQFVVNENFLNRWNSQTLAGLPGKGWVFKVREASFLVNLTVKKDIDKIRGYTVESQGNHFLRNIDVPESLLLRSPKQIATLLLDWMSMQYLIGYTEEEINKLADQILATPLVSKKDDAQVAFDADKAVFLVANDPKVLQDLKSRLAALRYAPNVIQLASQYVSGEIDILNALDAFRKLKPQMVDIGLAEALLQASWVGVEFNLNTFDLNHIVVTLMESKPEEYGKALNRIEDLENEPGSSLYDFHKKSREVAIRLNQLRNILNLKQKLRDATDDNKPALEEDLRFKLFRLPSLLKPDYNIPAAMAGAMERAVINQDVQQTLALYNLADADKKIVISFLNNGGNLEDVSKRILFARDGVTYNSKAMLVVLWAEVYLRINQVSYYQNAAERVAQNLASIRETVVNNLGQGRFSDLNKYLQLYLDNDDYKDTFDRDDYAYWLWSMFYGQYYPYGLSASFQTLFRIYERFSGADLFRNTVYNSLQSMRNAYKARANAVDADNQMVKRAIEMMASTNKKMALLIQKYAPGLNTDQAQGIDSLDYDLRLALKDFPDARASLQKAGYDYLLGLVGKPADMAVSLFKPELLSDMRQIAYTVSKNTGIQVKFDPIEKLFKIDSAEAVSKEVNGGIDLNGNNMGLDVAKNGNSIQMNLDPALVAEFRRGDFSGVVPVILKITPIANPVMTLGLETGSDEVKLARG